jgi:soluble lytic murein transglycosylase-like protein
MLNRMGQKYNVPPLFLKAVMLIESGGRPDAVGDAGHSVGLFQLHDQGYGHGMGDSRFDPEANADRAARGLAEAWQAGDRAGIRANTPSALRTTTPSTPGAALPTRVMPSSSQYNALRQEQGLPPVS